MDDIVKIFRNEDFTDEFFEKYKNYKLCFMEEIPSTYEDYDAATLKMMETAEYKQYIKEREEFRKEYIKTHHVISTRDIEDWEWERGYYNKFVYRYTDYPVKDHSNYTHYLYFTSDIEKQWGDDWDDPIHMAGSPYVSKDTDVIAVAVNIMPLRVDEDGEHDWGNIDIMSPFDYRTEFISVEEVNGGVMAWFIATNWAVEKRPRQRIVLSSRDNPNDCIGKIEKLNNWYKINTKQD